MGEFAGIRCYGERICGSGAECRSVGEQIVPVGRPLKSWQGDQRAAAAGRYEAAGDDFPEGDRARSRWGDRRLGGWFGAGVVKVWEFKETGFLPAVAEDVGGDIVGDPPEPGEERGAGGVDGVPGFPNPVNGDRENIFQVGVTEHVGVAGLQTCKDRSPKVGEQVAKCGFIARLKTRWDVVYVWGG